MRAAGARRRGSGLLAIALVGTGLFASAPAEGKQFAECAGGDHRGGDWPMFGHDAYNTRNQPDEKTIGPTEVPMLQPAWAFSAEDGYGKGDFTGTPIITDGCMYLGSNDGWVFAVNADTGEPVWSTKVKPGGINSTVGVAGGKVYASVSDVSSPYLIALDQDTGEILWKTTLDTQPGSDVYNSPQIFDGIVFAGVSGGSAELGDESDRYRFQGNYSLIDADSGRVLRKTYVIRKPDKNPKKPKNDFAGAAVWATPAYDAATKSVYVGAGNPFNPKKEHKYANSILKIDLDRSSRTFGEIVEHYKGIVDEYFPETKQLPCVDFPGNPPPYYPQGAGACGDLDLDFGASPNLFVEDGRLLVGEGQKSGVYHAADARTMKGEWKALVGPPSAVGGIVGSTAYDGDGVYGPVTIGGYVWSVDRADGFHRWFSAVGDGAHWGNAVSTANGVVYTVDLRGFLNAYDAATGLQLLASPMTQATNGEPTATWGGVSIARNTVYAAVGITGLPNGYIVAYRIPE